MPTTLRGSPDHKPKFSEARDAGLETADIEVGVMIEVPAAAFAIDGATSTRVCVCGGVASDPDWAVLAVGFGVDELSVPAMAVSSLRDRLARVSLPQAQDLAASVLTAGAPEHVREIVRGSRGASAGS
jgi:phosphoenolpyruvate-protein kinase (PTS system EI component)